MKYLIGAAALALSTSAIAQTTTIAPAQPAAPTAATAGPAVAEAPQTAPAPTTAPPATTTAEAAPPPAPAQPVDPKSVLAQQFPTYDKDANGTLNQTEFAAWLGEMKTAQNTEKLTPEQISKWANDSFAKADKDKTKSVTVAELQGFLLPNA